MPDGPLYTDDFNRANSQIGDNGGVGLGPNWRGGHWQILSNAAQAGDHIGWTYYGPTLPGPNMFAEADITHTDVVTSGMEVRLEEDNYPTGFTAQGGRCYNGSALAGGGFQIGRRDGQYGGLTVIASNATAHAANLRLRLEAEGTALRLYSNGVLVLSGTDATYTNGRFVGFGCNSPAAGAGTPIPVYDNFATGPVGPVQLVVANGVHAHLATSPRPASASGAVRIGSTVLSNVLVGATQINTVYLGPTPIWAYTAPIAADPPGSPVLTVTAADSSAALAWTAPANGGSLITGYRVDQSADGSTGWTTVTTVSGLGYTVPGLTNGTTYFFRVTAINGVGAGPPSNTVTTTPDVPGQWIVDFTDDLNGEPAGWTTIAGNDPGIGNATVISGVYQCPKLYWKTTARYDTALTTTNVRMKGEYIYLTAQKTIQIFFQNAAYTAYDGFQLGADGTTLLLNAGGGYSPVTGMVPWTPPAINTPFTVEMTYNNRAYTVKINNTLLASNTFTQGSMTAGALTYISTYMDGGSGLRKWTSGDVATGPPTAPGTPTGLAATLGNTQVALTWVTPASTGGAAITDYTVQYRTTTGPGAWNTFTHTASVATAITVTGLTNGTSYDFQVAAVNSVGTGSYSSTATAIPGAPTAPGAPTSLVVTPSSAQNTLTWLAPGSNGGSAVTGYLVETSANGTSGWSTVTTTGVVLTYTHTGRTNGTTYYYRVSAVNAIGTGSPSSVASGTPTASTWIYDFTDDPDGEPAGWTTIAGNDAGIGNATVISGVYQCPKTYWYSRMRNNTALATNDVYIKAELVYVSAADNMIIGVQNAANTQYDAFQLATNGGTTQLASGGGSNTGSWTPPAVGTPVLIELSWTAGVLTLKQNGTTIKTGSTSGLVPGFCFAEMQGDTGIRKWSSGDAAPPPPVPPGAPTGLGATAANTAAVLAWTVPSSSGGSAISDYTVQWRTTTGPGAWNTFTHTASTATGITVTGLTNGTSYDFQVAAVNSYGTSSYSSTATTTPAPPTVAGAPTSPVATAGDTAVLLTWVAPASNGGSAITGYLVETSANGTSGWSTVTTTGVVLSYTHTGRTNGTVYYYRISTVNAVGNSTPSSVVNATPAASSVYSDNFDRANGALGSPWVAFDGGLVVASNKCTVPDGNLNTSRYNQTITADHWAEADLTRSGAPSIGPCVRFTSGGDFYYFWNNSGSYSIFKRVSGSYSQVGSNGGAVATSFKARLEAQGTTIRLYIDGVLSVTGTDSSISTGQPGILGANGTGTTLDNFRASNLPYVP